MNCQNCNTEYTESEKICPACGRPTNVKTDFSFNDFGKSIANFIRKQELSTFQKAMSIVSAVTSLIFFICNTDVSVASAPLAWLCPVAVFIMLAAVFFKYDAASIPMAISYSIFLTPNLINVVKTFGYLRGANAALTFILCVLLYGNLAIMWLLATKVIKNTPVFKMIIAISSMLVGMYELYYLFRVISVSFVLSLHAIGWIGFVGTQAVILVGYDKKRVFGIFQSANKQPTIMNQPGYVNSEVTQYAAPASVANTVSTEQPSVTAPEQVATQQFIFCSQCGKKLPSDSAFCEYCGSKINH